MELRSDRSSILYPQSSSVQSSPCVAGHVQFTISLMARMREVPHVLREIGTFTFIKRVWFQIGDDAVFTWASALAYSWLFAIFPFLIFMLSLVPLIPEGFKASIETQVPDLVDRSVPSKDAAKIINDQ